MLTTITSQNIAQAISQTKVRIGKAYDHTSNENGNAETVVYVPLYLSINGHEILAYAVLDSDELESIKHEEKLNRTGRI